MLNRSEKSPRLLQQGEHLEQDLQRKLNVKRLPRANARRRVVRADRLTDAAEAVRAGSVGSTR